MTSIFKINTFHLNSISISHYTNTVLSIQKLKSIIVYVKLKCRYKILTNSTIKTPMIPIMQALEFHISAVLVNPRNGG